MLIADAYEFERSEQEQVVETVVLQERVLVVRSPAHAERQSRGLEKRLGISMK